MGPLDVGEDATEITMEVPDRCGLLADVFRCLKRNGVNVNHATIYTTEDGRAALHKSALH